jgi:hypothetical protein
VIETKLLWTSFASSSANLAIIAADAGIVILVVAGRGHNNFAVMDCLCCRRS